MKPNLSLLFRIVIDYLAILGPSASSRRVWSNDRLMITVSLNQLAAKFIAAGFFWQSWVCVGMIERGAEDDDGQGLFFLLYFRSLTLHQNAVADSQIVEINRNRSMDRLLIDLYLRKKNGLLIVRLTDDLQK